MNDKHSIRNLTRIAGAVIALSFGSHPAIVAGEAPPDPPLVASPHEPCAWTIEVKQKIERQPPPDDPRLAAANKRAMEAYPRMLHVTMEKAGKDSHEETAWDNGKTESQWIYNGWVIFRPANFPEDQALAMRVNDRLSPVKGGKGVDFPDLDWIRLEVFVKTVTYHGQRCFYYEDKTAQPLKGGDTLNPTGKKGVEAWIDVTTRLPVAVEDAGVLKKFHFEKDPPTQIKLTGIFATVYDDAIKRAQTPSTDQ